jgi:N utilization substance protein A
MEKLIAAGITTVESLADMTAEELGEVPGIGEKTVEKITVAVRHYFGHYEEGEERPVPVPAEPILAAGEEAVTSATSEPGASDIAEGNDAAANDQKEEHSVSKTPEEILADQAAASGSIEEVPTLSTEDLVALEDSLSEQDANDAADAREAAIENDNDTVDSLVNESEEKSSEGID